MAGLVVQILVGEQCSLAVCPRNRYAQRSGHCPIKGPFSGTTKLRYSVGHIDPCATRSFGCRTKWFDLDLDGTPRIALPLPHGDGERRYRLGRFRRRPQDLASGRRPAKGNDSGRQIVSANGNGSVYVWEY